MKKQEIKIEDQKVLEKFGANTGFVEYLFSEFNENPGNVTEPWQNFFKGIDEVSIPKKKAAALAPVPAVDDNSKEYVAITGSFAKILDNMNNSLSVPTATSFRSVPVKLMEENRILINQNLAKQNKGRVSFTHIVAFAIIKALKIIPSLNNSYEAIEGKSYLRKNHKINLGIAIDIEKKDGSRSLIVPNIKDAGVLNFTEFVAKYEDIIKRSKKGQVDPSEFMGTTISLTNPGTLGTLTSVPRLMQGQGAIIAIGSISYPAEYQAVSPSTISMLGISKLMNVTSTYDHRIIQGAESGIFLQEFANLILGSNEFYEEIFEALKIRLKPLSWKTDYQPGVFENNLNTDEIEKQARVLQLINLYRVRGHLVANLDPLGSQVSYHAELDPANYKFTMWDLDRQFITGGFGDLKTATLREILAMLQKTYCDKIGVEYMHIQNHEEKTWLQSKMEPVKNIPQFTNEQKENILKKLVSAEEYEHFIHTKFIGHKRFSLEGSETLIPVLDSILNDSSDSMINEVVLGMSHRGRLNVLANIIGKSHESIFSEFEDIADRESIGGSGDVKYHLGFSGKYKTFNNKTIDVSVASNPSHLEWVNPVVEGLVRAKQAKIGDNKEHRKVMAILIHGDAAFAGQGVVAETLNLSQLSGYRTGGTIHIIVNNQIGFTTTPEDARSSVYATDVAKMIQAPIFHVNGDDPEASVWVAKLAFEYRQIFKKDVVIDLFGYRRHGHNEGDEPGFTQPILYEKIKIQPSVMKLFKEQLLSNNIINEDKFAQIQNGFIKKMNLAFEKIKQKKNELNGSNGEMKKEPEMKEKKEIENIDAATLEFIVRKLAELPDGFNIHPKLKKFVEKRGQLLEEGGTADWAMAEALAFGSLLLENIPVRLSGQDSVRGTFSQRHLALTDIQTGHEFITLNHMQEKQAKLEALDSFLSEAAVLGFEYGYSVADPEQLVLWEAQFGDFGNGAQIIIDNFIVASIEKWQEHSKVVLLLPHGYEGQGPEHSSARLERFLTLCAENNMTVCNVTTPAQYFHLLRRQAKTTPGKPLVIMTPKSLLRHAEVKSVKEEFVTGCFKEFIDDNSVKDKSVVERVLLTSGKVYYELLKYKREKNFENAAVVRVEQFYPYEKEVVKEIISGYENIKEIVWVQEEPKNMGGWTFMLQRLMNDLPEGVKLRYSGRPASASPAVGSSKKSAEQQEELIRIAFEGE